MNKTICTILAGLFWLLNITRISAQKPPEKFGDIDRNNLEMKIYPGDTSAPAVYIFDWGSARFDYVSGFELGLKYHARIKILSTNGYDYANISLRHETSSPIYKLKAATYNLEDGKMVVSKLDRKNIFDEKVSGTLRNLKFTFPDVREGSIIEYSYEKNEGDFVHLVPWRFQFYIPVMHGEFNMRIPDYFTYKFHTMGYEPMESTTIRNLTDKGEIPVTLYRWAMHNIPAIKSEPYMPDIDNYFSRIEFELTFINIPGSAMKDLNTTWKKFEENLMDSDHFFKVTNNAGFIRDSVEALVSGLKTDQEKLHAIHRFVSNHMKWNNHTGMFTSGSLKKAYKEGEGNSAEINFLLMATLKQVGFQVYPVILSTRGHGIIRSITQPLVADYNYVVSGTKIDDKTFLMDATDPLLPYTELPKYCLNDKGYLFNGSLSQPVNLLDGEKYDKRAIAQVNLNEDGELEGILRRTYKGYSSWEIRKQIDADGEDDFLKNLKKEQGGWDIKSFEFQNLEKVDEPLVEKLNLIFEGQVQEMGDLIYLDPLLGTGMKENPFKEEKRIFPIDFTCPLINKYICSMNIPEGYSVDEVPKSIKISLPDNSGTYTYLAKVIGTNVQVMSLLRIDKPLIPMTLYPGVKAFFQKMVEKESEQIVLKKAGPVATGDETGCGGGWIFVTTYTRSFTW